MYWSGSWDSELPRIIEGHRAICCRAGIRPQFCLILPTAPQGIQSAIVVLHYDYVLRHLSPHSTQQRSFGWPPCSPVSSTASHAQCSLNEWTACRKFLENQVQDPVHVETELFSGGKVTGLSSLLRLLLDSLGDLLGEGLVLDSAIATCSILRILLMIAIRCLARGLPDLYENLE